MNSKKLKLGAMVLFALLSASPAHANGFDWLENLIGVGVDEPVASTTGAGGGGGDPGVDPN